MQQFFLISVSYTHLYLASDNIYDKNRALSDACSLLAEFYDYNNLHYIYGKPAYGEDSDTKVREIHDDMCLILKTYFYINDEESENKMCIRDSPCHSSCRYKCIYNYLCKKSSSES